MESDDVFVPMSACGSEHVEERLQHVELERHVLGHRLDDDVGAGAGVASRRSRRRADSSSGAAGRAVILPLLDELLELRADRLDGAERSAVGGVEEARGVSALGRDLRDSLAHGPGAEDGHVQRYRSCALVFPGSALIRRMLLCFVGCGAGA